MAVATPGFGRLAVHDLGATLRGKTIRLIDAGNQ